MTSSKRELGIGTITQGEGTAKQRYLSSEASIIAQEWFFGEAMDVAEVTGLLGEGIIDLTPDASASADAGNAAETCNDWAAAVPIVASPAEERVNAPEPPDPPS